MLNAVADKLTRPGDPIRAVTEASELLEWIPSQAQSIEDAQADAMEEIGGYPVLDARAKFRVMNQIRSRRGRPRSSRNVAVEALELHIRGESWREIELRLIPTRKGGSNVGEDVRRQAQFVKALLRRHGVTLYC